MADSKTHKYPVTSLIRHSGKDYAAGSTIDLTDEHFAALRDTGAIGLEPVGSPAGGSAPASELSADERAARIKAAITQIGAPGKKVAVTAVEQIVGFDVTRSEIDAALASHA